jgi:beta-fructofuranosidase
MREPWRQTFHLEPPRGWMNDPNGLCYFGGRYHVFFQYCPESAAGAGSKCWGHYESPDLLHWTFTGAPLLPDHPADRDGVYSGSAAADGETLYLYYTGNVKYPGDYDYIRSGREGNVLRVATRDGRSMGPKQLLLTNRDYPGSCSCHVRDPKVWRESGGWKMVLGARTRTDRGRVLVYHSPDGQHWHRAAIVQKKEPFGYMWECPDFFRLDGRGILSVSPQGLPHSPIRFQNVYQSGWFAVDGALESGRLGSFTEWDMGFDFYAPQTFAAPDGRRLMLGWMGLPDSPYENPTAALGWQHCLTVPRELFFDDEGRLCQRPARELEALLSGEKRTLPAGEAGRAELPCRITARPEGAFLLDLGGASLQWDPEAGYCTLAFSSAALGGGRTVRSVPLSRCREVSILADTSSLEIYLDGGAAVLATRFYPREGTLSLRAEGTAAAVEPMRPMEVTELEA